MNFKKLLDLLGKGEDFMDPLSGIVGGASSILNMLGVGRKRKIRDQKEMAENAAKINYKYGEMAAENAFEGSRYYTTEPTKTKATLTKSHKWMRQDCLQA